MTERFAADWLARREPHDAAARSLDLARALAAALPAHPRLLDLGAGTGSLFRFLAPVIGRDQAWTLADADPALLGRAMEEIAAWAGARGWEATAGLRALTLRTPAGSWCVEARLTDLAAGAPDMAGMDGVICSALLDLVSQRWLAGLADALAVPFLGCLSVDGRDALLPPHPLDRAVWAGFRRDQGRDKGFGPALGPLAPSALHAALAARGFTLRSAPSDWRIPPGAGAMLRDLVRSHAAVAMRRLPGRRRAILGWERARLRQIAAGRLAMRVGHRDILALPRP